MLSFLSFAKAQSNGSFTFTLTSYSCNSTNVTTIGDLCTFTLSIGVPAGNSSDLYVEIFPSDLNTSYAQLCKPSISIDTTGFPTLLQPQPQMISDFLSYSQVLKVFFSVHLFIFLKYFYFKV